MSKNMNKSKNMGRRTFLKALCKAGFVTGGAFLGLHLSGCASLEHYKKSIKEHTSDPAEQFRLFLELEINKWPKQFHDELTDLLYVVVPETRQPDNVFYQGGTETAKPAVIFGFEEKPIPNHASKLHHELGHYLCLSKPDGLGLFEEPAYQGPGFFDFVWALQDRVKEPDLKERVRAEIEKNKGCLEKYLQDGEAVSTRINITCTHNYEVQEYFAAMIGTLMTNDHRPASLDNGIHFPLKERLLSLLKAMTYKEAAVFGKAVQAYRNKEEIVPSVFHLAFRVGDTVQNIKGRPVGYQLKLLKTS